MKISCFQTLRHISLIVVLGATCASAQDTEEITTNEEIANAWTADLDTLSIGISNPERFTKVILGVPHMTRLVYCVIRSDGHQIRVHGDLAEKRRHLTLQATANFCPTIKATRHTDWAIHTGAVPGGAAASKFYMVEIIPDLEWMIQNGRTIIAVRREPCNDPQCLN